MLWLRAPGLFRKHQSLGSPPIKDVISLEVEKLGQYPDNRYTELREAAAAFVGVDVSKMVPGNGYSEIIRLFAETTLEKGDLAILCLNCKQDYG